MSLGWLKHATCANNSINYTFNYIWLSNHLLMNVMFSLARLVPFFSVFGFPYSISAYSCFSRNSTSTNNICGSIRKRLVCRMNKELCLRNGFSRETTTRRAWNHVKERFVFWQRHRTQSSVHSQSSRPLFVFSSPCHPSKGVFPALFSHDVFLWWSNDKGLVSSQRPSVVFESRKFFHVISL